MVQSISSYINPNTRGLTSNYKNTAIKDKETYHEAMSQHLLNPVEDLVQVLKTPIKLAQSSSISRQNNSVNIAEGQRIRVNGGHVLTVTAHETAFYTNEKNEISGICNQFLNGKTDQKLFCNEMKDRLNDYYGSRYELRNQSEAVEGRVSNMLSKLQHMYAL